MNLNDHGGAELIHVHLCAACGHASRRDDPDGTPDAVGIFRCSKCGYEGPLNDRILETDDDRLRG